MMVHLSWRDMLFVLIVSISATMFGVLIRWLS